MTDLGLLTTHRYSKPGLCGNFLKNYLARNFTRLGCENPCQMYFRAEV